MSSNVENIHFLTVFHRIVRLLYGLSISRASLRLPLTHSLLADLLGIHRVTVTNSIKELKKQGILDDTKQGIVIRDIDALYNVLN